MTVEGLQRYITDTLTPCVGQPEARAMCRVILEDAMDMDPVKTVMEGDRLLEPGTVDRILSILQRTAHGEPLQYVLGKARFHGLEIEVTPDVLIPRPETSQLVDIILDNVPANRKDLRVLDVCTGSGAIAVALARALPWAVVTAVDLSDAAVELARRNARRLHVAVDDVKDDALAMTMVKGTFDIIVCNPPYVTVGEKAAMDPRVLDHEPHMALFVPDDCPLVFYEAVGKFALTHLEKDGALYFEINPLFGAALRRMLIAQGWESVDVLRDYRGKERFAICRR